MAGMYAELSYMPEYQNKQATLLERGQAPLAVCKGARWNWEKRGIVWRIVSLTEENFAGHFSPPWSIWEDTFDLRTLSR